MTLNYKETKMIIDDVLKTDSEGVSSLLKSSLEDAGRTFPEFYDGVILHGPDMNYTSDQWFDFHQKIPHWRLQAEESLMRKLSPRQRELLEIG